MNRTQTHYADVLGPVYAWSKGPDPMGAATNWLEARGLLRGPRRVLDLGAGFGAHTLPLARAGAQVTAVDFDAALCPCCKGNPRPMTRRPTERTFRLGLHSSTRHLAMRGACPSHMMRCETEADARILWLGLTRAQ